MQPTPPASDEDAAVALLRLLEAHPDYSQRQLARELGVSLGKTHYRKLGYLYVLTPSGIRQRLTLTQAFLARKEREYVQLRTQISDLRKDLADQAGTRP